MCTYRPPHFLYSLSISGHLGYFCLLAIVSNLLRFLFRFFWIYTQITRSSSSFFFFFSLDVAYGILVPNQGSNPWPLEWRHSLNVCNAKEVPITYIFEEPPWYFQSGYTICMLVFFFLNSVEIYIEKCTKH